jgi:hypothetical protein
VRAFHGRFVLSTSPIVSGVRAWAGRNGSRPCSRKRSAAFRSETPGRPLAVTVRPRRAAERRENVALERKANVDLVIGRAVPLVRADADYLAATLANGILGQSTLSSRLGCGCAIARA